MRCSARPTGSCREGAGSDRAVRDRARRATRPDRSARRAVARIPPRRAGACPRRSPSAAVRRCAPRARRSCPAGGVGWPGGPGPRRARRGSLGAGPGRERLSPDRSRWRGCLPAGGRRHPARRIARRRKRPVARLVVRAGARAVKRDVVAMQVRELEALRKEIERRAAKAPRWNADPKDVQKSVARLVLALIEFLRKLLEKQAIRRMEAGALTAEEIQAIGVALMRLEETVHDLARRFGLKPEDLNLDLGPPRRLI